MKTKTLIKEITQEQQIDKFFFVLKQISSQFYWKSFEGCIRGYRNDKVFCPLTAILFILTSVNYSVDGEYAANILGISKEVGFRLIGAADYIWDINDAFDLNKLMLKTLEI